MTPHLAEKAFIASLARFYVEFGKARQPQLPAISQMPENMFYEKFAVSEFPG
jgi:hypothetical protein